MKRIANILLGISGMALGFSVQAQTDTVVYEVGTWEDFRASAITYTFDDNCPNQYSKAIPMFDALGFKGTFFTVTDWSPQWNTLKAMAENGHEIGSHCVTHISLYGLRTSKETAELRDSRDSINAHVPDQQCVTMAYPYCAVGEKSLCAQYYIAARGCQGFVEGKTPGDMLNISSIICGTEGSVETVAHFKEKIDYAVNTNGWCVFLTHGIDDDPDAYSPLSSAVFNNSLKYCKIRNYKVWVSTFANVSKYIRERDSASIDVLQDSDTAIILQVTDGLPDSVYNYPLTIRRPLPLSWPSAEVTQNDVVVNTKYIKVDTVTFVMFHAVPDRGEVRLVPGSSDIELTDLEFEEEDTIGEPEEPSAIEINTADPASDGGLRLMYRSGVLSFELAEVTGQDVRLSLYAANGSLLASYKFRNLENGRGTVRLPGAIHDTGICIVRLYNGKRSWAGKIMVN